MCTHSSTGSPIPVSYTHLDVYKIQHQPSPWINDYGQFSIMPVVGKPEFNEEKRASWFAHKGETATPYYYKVYLAEHDVVTEMAPTERAVLFRFTFPENDHSYVVVDAFDKGSYIKVIPVSYTHLIGCTILLFTHSWHEQDISIVATTCTADVGV